MELSLKLQKVSFISVILLKVVDILNQVWYSLIKEQLANRKESKVGIGYKIRYRTKDNKNGCPPN